MLKRNAIIVAGNHLADHAGDAENALLARLREIAGDGSEADLVRESARDVIRRVGGP